MATWGQTISNLTQFFLRLSLPFFMHLTTILGYYETTRVPIFVPIPLARIMDITAFSLSLKLRTAFDKSHFLYLKQIVKFLGIL